MFCPNCGNQTSDNSRYCTVCGYRFANNSAEQGMVGHSYYKESYKKIRKKTTFSFLTCFLKGVSAMLIFCLCIFGGLLLKNYYLTDISGIDKIKYQHYKDDPSLIPELTQPKTLEGLVDNLKDVQNFLVLYLKVSDDDLDTKLETFDKYRKEILKMQNFDNTNFLRENVRCHIPANEREFKLLKSQYDKILSPVGLMLSADESYSKYKLIEDNRFTYKKFGKYLPRDIALYFKLRARNYKPCIFKDRLAIKPIELTRRIGLYEEFLNSHQDFRYEVEIKDLLFTYSFVYSFTSDRTAKINIDKKIFKKSDEKFIKEFPNSRLTALFSRSTNTEMTEKEFDDIYPYKYQKTLDALKPENTDLTDIFTLVRKNIIQVKDNASYEFMYISSVWSAYNSEKPLKKGDVILARTDYGFEIYDYKYKKTNQVIKSDNNAKFFIKSNKLYAYSPKYLQISVLENTCGSFGFRILTPKLIKKIFPDVLIINIDTFGGSSVRIDKQPGSKTYMLISTSGVGYEGYRLSGDITFGELSNIFTVPTDEETRVDWCGEDENYHMYFVTHSDEQNSNSEDPNN